MRSANITAGTTSNCSPAPLTRPQVPRASSISQRKVGEIHKLSRSKLVIVAAQKQLKQKAQDQAKNVGKDLGQLGFVERVFQSHRQLQDSISISSLLQQSLIVGLTFGVAFQVTHNNGLLPVYDVWPIKIGPFLESGLVPIVLAPIWVLYGYLTPLLDEFFGNEESTQVASNRASSLSFVGLTWVLCAAQFILSDILYLQGVPHWQIYPVMAACTAGIWAYTDRTKAGFILGLLLAVGAPLGEAVIVAFGLWHYDRPDNPLGVCYWTAFCYASYAYGVGNFARWQTRQQKKDETFPAP